MKSKFPTWPSYEADEIKAAEDALRSGKVNYWTGEEARLFEKEYADYVGVQHAVAMMNGTVTMEAALKALDIGAGDEVIVPSHTFIATASVVVLCGATPVIADIDLQSNNLTVETIQAVLSPRTKAIIVVHLGGWPCDMDDIMAFARKHNLKVIEDCAQAHGARYKGKAVGSFGDISSFSFCQDKIITTGGEGGMVVTNDTDLWKKMWSMKDHGKSYDAIYNRDHAPGFRWVHESFGTNWRMTEMQAAIGRIQLKKLDGWVEKRQSNAKILIDQLQSLVCLRLPTPDNKSFHAYYRFYCYVKPDYLAEGWTRDRILIEMNNAGVPALWGGCSEIYREKAFVDNNLGHQHRLINAKTQGETSIVFPMHPTLSEDDVKSFGQSFKEIMMIATNDAPHV